MYVFTRVQLNEQTFAVVAKLCPVPEDIPIGSLEYNGRTYGSLATYDCPSGYLLSGFQKRVCKGDQTWSGYAPECKLKTECTLYYNIILKI